MEVDIKKSSIYVCRSLDLWKNKETGSLFDSTPDMTFVQWLRGLNNLGHIE